MATLGGVVTLSCPCGRPWRAQERILSPQFIRAVCFFMASVHTCHHEGGMFWWGHEEQGWLDCSWRSWVRQVDRIEGGQDAAHSQPLRGTAVCGGAPGSWWGHQGCQGARRGPVGEAPALGILLHCSYGLELGWVSLRLPSHLVVWVWGRDRGSGLGGL